MPGIISIIKKYIWFSEPVKAEKFVLKENEDEELQSKPEEQENSKQRDNEKLKENDKEDISRYIPKRRKNEELILRKDDSSPEKEKKSSAKNEDKKTKKKEIKQEDRVRSALEENRAHIEEIYSVPENGDLVIREFEVIVHGKPREAFIVFFDGLADRTIINNHILQPLMLLANIAKHQDDREPSEIIKNQLINHNQVKETRDINDVIDEVNFGGCGVFIDGLNVAYAADVKGWEHRNVGRPNTELVIRGPQEGFTELLRVNTGLLRKILKDENLVAETITLGKRSKTPCSLMYIRDIVNNDLVNEVRRRLKSIKVDYVLDTGELEQLIEDSTFLPMPQIMATERPDKVAAMLAEGKVAIVLNGNPFVLVMPTTFTELVRSAEDNYLRYPYGNLIKVIRYLGVFVSVFLPGLYIAVTNYHQEMIPTDLLIAIAASREKVPFPAVVEILIMEIAFELIREAGIRIPGPIGPTLGIIGALILGQAAVAANIVSPILIIIVAVTGIGSFAIPNFSLSFSFRLLRFVYIFLAAMAGFLGLTLGLFVLGLFMVNAKSFGAPMMVPIAPKTSDSIWAQFMRPPMWKQEKRPDYANTKKPNSQEPISRGWYKEDLEKEAGDEE